MHPTGENMTGNLVYRRDYAAVLGDQGNAWQDGTLDADEIAADPEAAALVQAFREQMAAEYGESRAAYSMVQPYCDILGMP